MSSIGRVGRVGLAVLTLVAGLAAERAAAPPSAFACSCMVGGPERIGTFADQPSIIVFTGTVVSVDRVGDQFGHTRGQLLVHRVFKGTIPAARMPVVGGGGGDCTISLQEGQQMITAASFENGEITPGLCMPYGDPTTPDGQRLIAEAEKAYGAGAGPPGGPSEPTTPPKVSDTGTDGAALPLAVAGAVGVAVLLFGGLILLTRRKPNGSVE